MAYPFAQMPTAQEFEAWAISEGANLAPVLTMAGPRGQTQIRALERSGGRFVLPHPPGSRMVPSQVRSACRALGLDLNRWGFTLDDLQDGIFDEPEAKA